VVEARGEAADVTSEPQSLATLLIQTRAVYQSSLVATAQARKQLDADIKAVRANAKEDSHRFNPAESVVSRFFLAWDQSGEVGGPEPVLPRPPQDLAEAEQMWHEAAQVCQVILEKYREERTQWESTKKGLFRKPLPEPRLPATFQRDALTLRQVLDTYRAVQAEFVCRVEEQAVPNLKATFETETLERDRQLAQVMRSNLASIQMGIGLLGVSGQPWEARLAGVPSLSSRPRGATRLGSIRSGLPHPYDITVPCVINFPSARGLALEATMQVRDRALDLLRSLVLRVLTDVPPGQLLLSFVDPTAMGQTFAEFAHLGDYEERLIDTAVKTSAHAIERCLGDHVAHLETVISKYLRGQFENIHDYNRHAGEMTEPYRLLVIADYPKQFSDRAAEQLLSLVENGPRCGVYTLLLYSPEDEEPRGSSFARLTQSMDVIRFQGQSAEVCLGKDAAGPRFDPDRCPPIAFDSAGRPATPAAEFIEALGRATKQSAESVVTLDNFLPVLNRNRAGVLPDFRPSALPLSQDPESWWTATTADTAVAPIGRSGAQGVASMFFSSTTVAGGAIMVGLPRSGKTTSLHAMILTMALLYSPKELELYLIDAKHGVEFKAYEDLPHARMVSIHSEREFSRAVLKSIQARIKERAELIKRQGSGLSNITEYRRVTRETLPRIVVVVDEFHELFEEADSIGLEAFAAFSDIVRMGSFSGVHIVVASQTLSSMPAMDRQTLTLLPQRVAFMCNEYDAEILMGDTNKSPRLLSKTGEGLFNPARGDESKNQLFQGLYVEPEQRGRLLRGLRAKADAEGFTRHPRVFDGDKVVARPPLAEVLKPSHRFAVPVGEPFTLAESESIVVPRTRGANVLLIGDRDDEETPDHGIRSVVHSFLLAAAAQQVDVTVVDFIGDEEIEDGLTVMDVADIVGAQYVRSGGLPSALSELAATVSDRTAAGEYKAPTQWLMLFGLQRALSLTPYDPYSVSESDGPSLAELLALVVTGGPEVGVHVVVDTDRSRSVEMRLGSELLGEFTLRVAGSAADQKDLGLVTGAYGDVAPLRPGQLLIGDLLKGTAKRARGYEILRAAPGRPDRGVGHV
jgi:hypothetical protein